jgi:hypothetical protein
MEDRADDGRGAVSRRSRRRRLTIRNGAKLIKPLLVITCIALAVRLMMDPAHPLRMMLGF